MRFNPTNSPNAHSPTRCTQRIRPNIFTPKVHSRNPFWSTCLVVSNDERDDRVRQDPCCVRQCEVYNIVQTKSTNHFAIFVCESLLYHNIFQQGAPRVFLKKRQVQRMFFSKRLALFRPFWCFLIFFDAGVTGKQGTRHGKKKGVRVRNSCLIQSSNRVTGPGPVRL